MADVVYALHTFEAENEDELTFEAGERIIVLERDDQYSDGWYQGRNERGEIGLFPQSYTSSRPPTPEGGANGTGILKETTEEYDTASSTPLAAAGAFPSPPTTVVDAAAPAGLAAPTVANRRHSVGETSLHSHFTEDGDEEDAAPSHQQRLSDGAAHRAALAAKVSENAERDAQAARELAERRKQEDEERYAKSAGQVGLIDGLQLSDESDEEEEEQVAGSLLPLAAPLPALPVSDLPAALGAPLEPQAVEERPDLRPRADTETSTYTKSDSSVYANQSATIDSPIRDNTAAPIEASAPIADAPGLSNFAAEQAPSGASNGGEEAPRSGEHTPTHPAAEPRTATQENGDAQNGAHSVVGAGAAGLAGALGAGAAAMAVNHHAESRLQPASQSPLATSPTRDADAPTRLDVNPPVEAASVSSAANALPTIAVPDLAGSASRASPLRSPPLVVDTAPTFTPSLGSQLNTPLSASNGAFSPTSTIRSTASPIVAWDTLPADPVDWSVDNVVDWGQQKGFDESILSKFAEHEITGDVLLEMDVAMLKEIDLIAFGRRVRVYNAIKELRHRTQPGNLMSSISSTGGPVASNMSGYGSDGPGALAYSPTTGVYAPSTIAPQPRWDPAHDSSKPLAGLGLQDEMLTGERAIPADNARTDVAITSAAAEAATHGHALEPVAETPVPAEARTPDPSRPAKDQSRLSSAASSLRPRSSRRGRTSDGKDEVAPEAAAPSPDVSKENKGDKAGFSVANLPVVGRNRKPPPRVPSALLIDSDGAVARPRQRTTLQDRARRSTRLFSSFGGTSASDKSPTTGQSVRSQTSNSTLAVGRDAPTAMSVKSVDPATQAMQREKGVKVTSGNLMDKIGRPDHSGWMRKKGEQYNTWKMRFFVLKGTYLYYLKSEAEQRAKGVIDLTGYRVISDPDIRPGEFAFKITHPSERTHYFAAAEQITIRTWMKEILKATIFRDYSAPVVSSCDIETLSLDAAKTLSPRPPSPTQRAEIQKKRYAGSNPNTLSQKDAAILMELAPGSAYSNGENLYDSVAKRPSVAPGETRKASVTSLEHAQAAQHSIAPPVGLAQSAPAQLAHPAPPSSSTAPILSKAGESTANPELLRWVNANLPTSCSPVPDLSKSLRSGRPIVRLLENLSGRDSGISDASFEKFNQDSGVTFDPAYLDTLFSVFDYISPLASTDDVSMEDMMTGNAERMQLLLERIRTNFPGSSA
ncbi:hypothetical protein JCM10908_002927 [Rhodotorula pacifica]|uniref:uncharacterized protein n=1 Tax=Rhodotorula pacifica TaxID=1495444 RepID=UPI003179944B